MVRRAGGTDGLRDIRGAFVGESLGTWVLVTLTGYSMYLWNMMGHRYIDCV